MLDDATPIFSYEEIRLNYLSTADSYVITTPLGRWIALPSENLEDMLVILTAAKNHRDFGFAVCNDEIY